MSYQRAHLNFVEVPQGVEALLLISLAPRIDLLRRAVLAALVGCVTLVPLAVAAQHGLAAHHAAAAPFSQSDGTLLLAVVAFLQILLLRNPSDGELSRSLLAPLRLVSSVPAVLAFGAAVAIVIDFQSNWTTWILTAAAAGSIAAFALTATLAFTMGRIARRKSEK